MTRDRSNQTPEEIRDEVLDRIRGGPGERMRILAGDCSMSYQELMTALADYAEDRTDHIGLGSDIPDYDEVQMWQDFELITGINVPADKRDAPFTCAC